MNVSPYKYKLLFSENNDFFQQRPVFDLAKQSEYEKKLLDSFKPCSNNDLLFFENLKNFIDCNNNNIDQLFNVEFAIGGLSKETRSTIALLHLAIYANKYEYVAILLKHGANPDTPMLDGSTALHIAVKENSDIRFISLLLNYKSSTNISNQDGLIPLHYACCIDKDTKIASRLLLSNPGVANIPNKEGRTVLHLACLHDNVPLVTLLLEVPGIQIDARDNNGATPLYYSAVKNPEITELLLNKGAIVDIQTDKEGETALIYACRQKNNLKNVTMLLQSKANFNINRKDSGWQAIHYATKDGREDVVCELLKFNADANAKTPILKGGVTPLMLALKYNNNRLAEQLIAHHSADIHSRGTDEVVGCFSDTQDQCGMLCCLSYLACCFWMHPCLELFACCDDDPPICKLFSYATNTVVPCCRPKAISFSNDSGLLKRAESRMVVVQQLRSSLYLNKDS